MEKMVFLKIKNRKNINLFLLCVIMTLMSCSSSKKSIEANDYKETNFFIEDYLSLTYNQGYIEDYDVFKINIESIKTDYYLMSIYPFLDKIILNSSDFRENDLFPQSYKEIKGKTFFIDFQYKTSSNTVYDKLIEKNKIDSTYILVEQGKISKEEGIIMDKLNDSIFSQKYLVKNNRGKLELIYDWFGK